MWAGRGLQGTLRRKLLSPSSSPPVLFLLPLLRCSHTIPGRATRRGCHGFYDRLQKDQEEEDQMKGQSKGGGESNPSSRMLTAVLPKAGWEVGALSFGLPRRPHGLGDALETTLMAAVVIAKQNLIQVYDASSHSSEEIGLTSCRALHTLIQTRRLIHREELVTCATINYGHDLEPESITRGLDRARFVTGLETIDLATVTVDLEDHRTPRGQPLLESLRRMMECLDRLAEQPSSSPSSPSSSSSFSSSSLPPLQHYAIELRLPFYMQHKNHQELTEEEAPGYKNAGMALTTAQQEELLLPRIVEEAALVGRSKLAMVTYPIQLTGKHLVTLPLMQPESKAGRQGQMRPVSRLARGALVGCTDAGESLSLSSELLPPDTVTRLNAALNGMSPALRSSPLLEAKVIRSVLAAEIDIVQLDVDDMLGLLPRFTETGGLLVRRKDRLQFQQCRRVFDEFYLPAL